MKAAIIAASRNLRVVDSPKAEPAGHQIRVRLQGCGVCASNLPVWEGRPWFSYPFTPGAPGHEGWGWIEALGEGVTGLQIGDRVAMVSPRAYAQHDVADVDAVVKIPPSLAD